MHKRLAEQNITMEVTAEAKAKLVEDGYDPAYGARPLRRTIQRSVEDALSEEIIAGKIALGDAVRLYVEDGRIAFERIAETVPEEMPQ